MKAEEDRRKSPSFAPPPLIGPLGNKLCDLDDKNCFSVKSNDVIKALEQFLSRAPCLQELDESSLLQPQHNTLTRNHSFCCFGGSVKALLAIIGNAIDDSLMSYNMCNVYTCKKDGVSVEVMDPVTAERVAYSLNVMLASYPVFDAMTTLHAVLDSEQDILGVKNAKNIESDIIVAYMITPAKMVNANVALEYTVSCLRMAQIKCSIMMSKPQTSPKMSLIQTIDKCSALSYKLSHGNMCFLPMWSTSVHVINLVRDHEGDISNRNDVEIMEGDTRAFFDLSGINVPSPVDHVDARLKEAWGEFAPWFVKMLSMNNLKDDFEKRVDIVQGIRAVLLRTGLLSEAESIGKWIAKHVCSACGATSVPQIGATADAHVVSLMRCSTCQLASYCNEECHRKHWNAGHKDVCKNCEGVGKANEMLPSLPRAAPAMPPGRTLGIISIGTPKVPTIDTQSELWRNLVKNCAKKYRKMLHEEASLYLKECVAECDHNMTEIIKRVLMSMYVATMSPHFKA